MPLDDFALMLAFYERRAEEEKKAMDEAQRKARFGNGWKEGWGARAAEEAKRAQAGGEVSHG